MLTCTRLIQWDMGHRVLGHEGKCNRLHGHRYVAEVTCRGELDSLGRVIDFGVIKEMIGGYIDGNWDHRTMLFASDPLIGMIDDDESVVPSLTNPTAENIAATILKMQHLLDGSGVEIVKVRVWETPNCYAEATNASQ